MVDGQSGDDRLVSSRQTRFGEIQRMELEARSVTGEAPPRLIEHFLGDVDQGELRAWEALGDQCREETRAGPEVQDSNGGVSPERISLTTSNPWRS